MSDLPKQEPGESGEDFEARLFEWLWETCPTCKGQGRVRKQPKDHSIEADRG